MHPPSKLEPGRRKSGYGNRVAWLASLPRHSVGAEIGVLTGKFTKHLLSVVKPRCLYLVDCWCAIGDSFGYSDDLRQATYGSRVLREVVRESVHGLVRPLCGWSAEVADLIADKSLDWLYVDADHTLDGCMADLKAWFPKLKRGGIVAGHDYVYGWACSVPEAVRRFMWSIGRDVDGVQTTDGQDKPTFWFRK